MRSTKSKTNLRTHSKTPWIILLIQTLSKHWLSLLFVGVIVIVFRMPHLSDLVVVIIELKNHYAVIPAFYAAIVVMAVLISYGYLVVDNAAKSRAKKQSIANQPKTPKDIQKPIPEFQNESADTSKVVEAYSKPSVLKSLRNQLSLQDPKEKEVMSGHGASEKKGLKPTEIAADHENFKDKAKHNDASEHAQSTRGTTPATPKSSVDSTLEETPRSYMDRVFPKFLGTFMILSIAFSVNNTIEELYGQTFVPAALLWIIMGVFVLLTHKNASDYIKKQLRWKSDSFKIPVAIIITGFFVIILFGIINQGGTPRDINFLFISMSLLAFLFLILNVSYNKNLLAWKAKYIEPLVFICFSVALVCYMFMFFRPSSPLNELTPMVILMLSLMGMFIMFTGLKYWGARTGWPILSIAFFGAILLTNVFAKNSNFKHYEITNTSTKQTAAERLDLDTYVDLWIENRAEGIASASKENPFPIIMVSAEGGGSRAGHWAMLVHSYLYEQNEAYFKTYLFSITGASGGSVGSNIFYTQAYERRHAYDSTLFRSESGKGYTYKASDFYQNDYISSSIAGLLGRDLFASITNFSFFKDRGELTELEWEAQANKYFGNTVLQRSYLDIMPTKKEAFIPPIMVTTTTHVQTGAQYIMSPVKFEPNDANEMVFKDLLSEYHTVYPDSLMIKRSTGMLLTARFPYLSPNGRITGIGQFGDGGYYDNIGGVVTTRLEQALIKGLKKVDSLKDKYKIKHLIINNNTDSHAETCSKTTCQYAPKITYNSQLLTPALMVINATFAPADQFVASYPDDFRVESKRTSIPISNRGFHMSDTISDSTYRPLIPLGRYMSKASVLSLEERLKDKEVQKKLEHLLRFE